ncbi:MAG: nickel pincer cofactor biosynthesis protein LarB [Rhodospirillaceae bacterium]|jgi:hypothetical protein|nr:nickel pincer cofactor biosynthesis protein LarB [Rhodospirillaceae bacterium]MBT3495120.1 nickel pincer cofactor biosynthesis protein LarB [Rhodospirillaceae bacterium]MBT3782546.1 nickel pincer cofactor biosynthesis protein LarB [Rhodospirillaceae bacterium]MBT3977190.1 nickel pincer cofactor biosynthesis protein LarB [Rhodospirillaceae bacterium]MBT4168312.1 nickel pincer cofactor biosynthesis protein LarB [Rhodospirillaceae bacterium]
MAKQDSKIDFGRGDRLGLGEAVFCLQKSARQIDTILDQAQQQSAAMLLTRLDSDKHAALAATHRAGLDYDPASQTAFFNWRSVPMRPSQVAVVTAGTSDAVPAREALRTLAFNGIAGTEIFDVGVAGIWRLMERIEDIKRHPVVIAVAGMDAALPSVLGGLIPGALIAVPTSTGYGAARGGETALFACLSSCAPGVTVCNIDNGYGAACAALRILAAGRMLARETT